MPDNPTQRIPPDALRYMVRSQPAQPSPRAQSLHLPVFVLYIVGVVGLLVASLAGWRPPAAWGWVEGLVFVAAAATSLVSLGRRLPPQNVFACGAVLFAIISMAHIVGAKTGMPFGKFEGTEQLGPRLLKLMVWPVPFLWVAVLLSCRGVAKLVLRPYRRNKRYGWLLLLISSVLGVCTAFAVEPFAVASRGWWRWDLDPKTITLWGVPWTDYAGWWAMSWLALAFATPWLIQKRPVQQATDAYPLVVWLSMLAVFAGGNIRQGLWGSVGIVVAVAVVATILSVRGMKAPTTQSTSRSEPTPAAGPAGA